MTPPPDDLELHRPYVDEVVLRCPECGGEMRRVPEVIDAWFDSGAMPFAQWHYPFENVEVFERALPGRLHRRGDRPDARLVLQPAGHRHPHRGPQLVQARALPGPHPRRRGPEDEQEPRQRGASRTRSSTSRAPTPSAGSCSPASSRGARGASAPRWSTRWCARFLLTLWNTYSFFTVYANIDRFDPTREPVPLAERPLLDRWLVGELNTLGRERHRRASRTTTPPAPHAPSRSSSTTSPTGTCGAAGGASGRASHDRDKLAAYHTLYECLVTLAKLLAPFTPFIAEELYQNLVRSVDAAAPESVHLCAWPVADEQAIDAGVSFDMAAARRVVEMGRAARNAAAVKTRQPLAEVVVALPDAERAAVEGLRDVVLDELNVKELRFVGDGGELVSYTVKPNLRLLGPKLGKQLGAVQAALQ